MAWKLLPRLFTSLSAVLLLQLSVAQAQLSSPVAFKPPKNQPAPKITVGGGRRSSSSSNTCPQVRKRNQSQARTPNQGLTLLLPSTKLGVTVSPHPTFIVYVPPQQALAVELTLENEQGQGIFQKTVNLNKNQEIVSITLPQSEASLQVGKDYKWVVSMHCQQTGPFDPFAEGVIRRIQPDRTFTNKLKTADSLKRVKLYASTGIWFDAATNLLELRRSQPNNKQIAIAWQELLRSVGLDAIAEKPLN